MVAAVDPDIGHAASATLRLAINLARALRADRQGSFYPREADSFLSYASKTLEWIRNWTEQLLQAGVPVGREVQTRLLLAISKSYLSHLHRETRRILDADTLRIPYALARVVSDTARAFEPQAELVLSTSDDFNWYHHPIRTRLAQKQAPWDEPPAGLGLISVPYSESASALANVPLFHELGHFLFPTRGLEVPVVQAMTAHLLARGQATLWTPQSEALQRVLSWSQELYCDLLATAICGPALLIALCRIQDGFSSTIAEAYLADPEHPPAATRLAQMREYMKELKIYDRVRADVVRVDTRLTAIEASAPNKYLWEVAPLDGDAAFAAAVVEGFVDAVAPILRRAADLTPAATKFQSLCLPGLPPGWASRPIRASG